MMRNGKIWDARYACWRPAEYYSEERILRELAEGAEAEFKRLRASLVASQERNTP